MGEKKEYKSYNEAAHEYLSKFQMFTDPPAQPSSVVVRGAGEIAVETLIDRADDIARISADMVELSKVYMGDPNPIVREGMSGHLLSQVAAELSVATELLEIIKDGETKKPVPVTRLATRSSILNDSIGALSRIMTEPITVGFDPFIQVQRTVKKEPKLEEEAKQSLEEAAKITTEAIISHVIDSGADIASKLIFETEWSAVIVGTGLIGKKFTDMLGSIKEGLETILTKAVVVVTKILLNVYNKILALLGKDIESEARKKISEWLNKIKQDGKIEVLDYLIGRLYRVNDFRKDLNGWITNTKVDIGNINVTTTIVERHLQKFIVLSGRINKISDITGLARLINIPQINLVITSIRVALLASIVYTGYDYIGYKQVRFPNLTTGLAEVIKGNLFPDSKGIITQ